MREGIKEKREERNRIGRRGEKKLGKEGGKKRETGQEVKERESYVGFRLTKTTCVQTCSIFWTPAYGQQGVGQPPKYHRQKKNRCVSLSFL